MRYHGNNISLEERSSEAGTHRNAVPVNIFLGSERHTSSFFLVKRKSALYIM